MPGAGRFTPAPTPGRVGGAECTAPPVAVRGEVCPRCGAAVATALTINSDAIVKSRVMRNGIRPHFALESNPHTRSPGTRRLKRRRHAERRSGRDVLFDLVVGVEQIEHLENAGDRGASHRERLLDVRVE